MAASPSSNESDGNSPDARRFRALVECSSDAIFLTDFDSAQFVEVNQEACRLFGYSADELKGKTGRQLHPPELGDVVDEISRDLVDKGSAWRPAVRFIRKDGTSFSGELRSHCYEFEDKKLYVAFIRDLSFQDARERELQEAYGDLRETQSQLVHSARLAAVGQLAAGIAHEVNNPAAYVMTNLEVLAGRLSTIDRHSAEDVSEFFRDATESIVDCLEGLERISAIVKGLKAFARIDHKDIEEVSINDVVTTATNLVRPQTRHAATVELQLEASHLIVADRGKIVQVVVNLLLNAAQAIDEGTGGRISVTTRDTPDGCLLNISDDGPGIPEHLTTQIFDPFFTTKPVDKGTGLGLSLCSDILNQHRASIRVRRQERGANFEIQFPKDTGLVPAEATHQHTAAPKIPRARLLIVDDEVPLVRAYRRSLGQFHDVVVAYNGEEALAILENDQHFDVILCDLMMPFIDGVELYESAIKLEPSLEQRFVFCTGGATSARAHQFIANHGIHLLEKPVDFMTLSQAILQVISGK